MELYNINNQLRINTSNSEEFYKFETMKSFSPEVDAKNNWYVLINFIANDKNNSLRLYVKDVTNLGFTNSQLSAIQLVRLISQWASTSASTPVSVKSPFIIRSTGAALTLVPANVSSISFSSTGTANATILVNGTTIIIKPGETVSYDAGGINNYMPGGVFYYNTSAAGCELLIAYVAL